MVLAFLLWTVTKSDSRKVIRDVPIRVLATETGWVQVGTPDPEVLDVRVAGPVRELFGLTASRAQLQVRVDEVSDSVVRLPLRPSQVVFTEGADSTRVEGITGDHVVIRFEEIAERVLPVSVRTIGAPPPGMVLDGMPRPLSNVRVMGGRSRVAALDSLPVADAIDLSALTTADTIPVVVDTAGLGLTSVSSTTVDVYVPLRLAPDTTGAADVALLQGRR